MSAGPDRTVVAGASLVLQGTATDDGALTSVDWTFGDGSSAAGPFAQHAYARPGSFTAVLTATDRDGHVASDAAIITVVAPGDDPVVDAGRPVTAFAGDRVAFRARPLALRAPLVGYAWRFGDGTKAVRGTTTHVYRRPGRYAAVLDRHRRRGPHGHERATGDRQGLHAQGRAHGPSRAGASCSCCAPAGPAS